MSYKVFRNFPAEISKMCSLAASTEMVLWLLVFTLHHHLLTCANMTLQRLNLQPNEESLEILPKRRFETEPFSSESHLSLVGSQHFHNLNVFVAYLIRNATGSQTTTHYSDDTRGH